MPIVDISNAKAKGLMSEAERIYAAALKERAPWVTDLLQEADSDGAYEDYHTWKPPAKVNLWNRGDSRRASTFSDLTQRITNYDFNLAIDYHYNDLQDDRAPRKFIQQAREAGQGFAEVDELCMEVLINNTPDPDTLMDIPNCADGYPLFSTSHSEATDGNIVTGTAAPTNEYIISTDIQKAFRRCLQYQDPNRVALSQSGGYIYKASDIRNSKKIILVSPQYYDVFEKAFNNDRQLWGGTINGQSGLATPSNSFMRNLASTTEIIPWQYLDGEDDWYMFLSVPRFPKPFIRQNRQGLEMRVRDMTNSDRAVDLKILQLAWDARRGYGPLNWLQALKVDN